MSDDWKSTVARRPLLAALGALVSAGVAGGILYEGTGLLRNRNTGPYGSLLSGLGSRDDAVVLGRAVLGQVGAFDPHRVAETLRARIAERPLAALLAAEAARGEVTEIRGWVLPATLATLCALAAKAG
jgi:hypothetical protein